MFNSNQQDKQEELFDDLAQMSKKIKKKGFSLGRIALSLSYENTFLVTIGLIMLLIVCYSLGVEKGKRLARLKSESIEVEQGQLEKRPQFKSLQPPLGSPQGGSEDRNLQQPKQKKTKVKVAQAQKTSKAPPYIQVASFRTDKYARKEKEQLEEKGYQSFVATWGNFKVVCVGGYKNRAEASSALHKLRKLYADCILHNE